MSVQAQQYLVRSGALAGFEELVTSLGGDPHILLQQCHLTPADFKHPDNMIPYGALIQLLELSASDLKIEDFDLRLAAKQDFQMLGPLGLLVQASNTAREALTLVQRYMAVHNQGEYWTFEEFGKSTMIERYEVFHGVNSARQNKELSIGVCFHLIKLLIGNQIKINRIEFAHSPLSATSFYRQFFECEVLFNQEQDRLFIDSHYLNQPIQSVSTENKQSMESYVIRVMEQYGDDIERQIKSLILQTLGLQEHSIENIAAMMNLHKRTLQRRLAQEKLKFKSILTEVRINTACWHLEASSMDITLLSEMLGYSDISAFSRAFKSQKGLSPLQWRKQHSI